MSYLLYINENLIELPNIAKIPQTLQVNDLAQLDNRQSNLTSKFIVPFTANNIRAMEGVYLAGNNSNFPYQKNECNLYDADSGTCLIYKGWAVVSKTTGKGYEINVYDGIIDFYRKIENKTFNDVGISALNHVKNINNIVGSWNNDKPYMYAIADYNGNNNFTPPSGIAVQINSDYQIPCARVSFLWNKIFEFAGFTYSGAYFQKGDFTNLFMTFPKPVPTKEPITDDQMLQNCTIDVAFTSFGTFYNPNFFPDTALLAAYNLTGRAGAFKISATGSFLNVSVPLTYIKWTVINSTATIVLSTGFFNTENNGFIVISKNIGDILLLEITDSDSNPYLTLDSTSSTDMVLSIEHVFGYEANFEEAFIDFNVTDFVNEIMQEGGLTAFKNKYTNHIDFLQLNEILASGIRLDWSDKFQFKESESYKIGRYAKLNNFRYRYNAQNEKHNDGSFQIQDENLQDSFDALNSKLYTPERNTSKIYGKEVPIFKIWEKELKDTGEIEHKELTGRFYFLRVKSFNNTIRIASQALNTEATADSAMYANYLGLKFSELINDNYYTIATILNKGKIINAYFDLKPKDIETFSFKIPIYIEQLASNYIVNKIINFTKGKNTKCELLEVDYKPATDIIVIPEITFITIDSFEIKGCQVTVNYSTDAPIGTFINFTCTLNNFGIPSTILVDPIYNFFAIVQNIGFANTFTFTLLDGAFYVMYFQIPSLSIISNQVFFENNGTCSIADTTPVLSRLTIDNVVKGTTESWLQNWSITFTSDVSLPVNIYVKYYTVSSGTFGLGGWSDWNLVENITSTTFNYISGMAIFGPITKFKLRIGIFESNEYIL